MFPRRCSQSLPAPVPGRQQRYLDLGPIRGSLTVVVVQVRVGEDTVAEVDPVRRELPVGQCVVPAHERAGHTAARTALAQPVLHHLDLLVVPVLPERRQDPAVVGGVAVEVAGTLPDADRVQVRWPAGGDEPLVHRVVGHPRQPDTRIGPLLHGSPLDTRAVVRRLTLGEVIDVAGRTSAPPGVDPHDRIPVGRPLLRIHHLPVLVRARRTPQSRRDGACSTLPTQRGSRPETPSPWRTGRS